MGNRGAVPQERSADSAESDGSAGPAATTDSDLADPAGTTDSDLADPAEPGDDDFDVPAEPGDDDFDVPPPNPEGRGRRRYGSVALALAIVVGLLLGYGVGWIAPRLAAPGDDSVEAGFARDMILHHAQAVEMGLIAFQRGTDPAVRQIAVDIATSQQGEIGMMHAWLDDWGLDPTGSAPAMAWMPAETRHTGHGTMRDNDGLMPGMADAKEMASLREATGKELDVRFLQLMIRHHLGGVHMIDAALAASDQPEVVRAARTMKGVQQTELVNLNQLLTDLGGAPLPAE